MVYEKGTRAMSDTKLWIEFVKPNVLKRDNYECQICKSKNRLHVHHLIQRKDFLNCTINDLLTLCASCHRIVHGNGEEKRKNNEMVNRLKIIKGKGLLFNNG